MHLPDGIVPVEMALAGYAASAALAAISLARIRALPDPQAQIPRVAMLTTVFFAASLLAVPAPPASVHLTLAGLIGVMLGWFALPAILVGLFLQAVLFGHGGLTALGLNGVILGLPALMAFGLWRLMGRRWPDLAALAAGGGAVLAALAILAAIVLAGLPVALDAGTERMALRLLVLAHLPLVLAEGVIVLVLLRVLRRIEPGLLPHGEPGLCPRARLVIALVLAFAVASLRAPAAMPVVAALAAGVALASGQGRQVMARLRGPAILALAFVLVLPLISGQSELVRLGPVALYREGLAAGVLIAVRLLGIVALTLAILAPLAPLRLVAGLRGLGVPALMADLALLTLRYLDELTAELRRARLARRLRGGHGGWRALPEHAFLLAAALIRAQGRADRLWAAMRLRGHGSGLAAPPAPMRAAEWAAITGAVAAALALVALDRSL